MKKKKPFARLATVGIFVVVIGLLYFLNKHYHFFGDGENTVKVEVDEHVSSRHVRIRKGFYSGNRENDAEMLSEAANGELIYDGVRSSILKTDHGENDFLIIYEGLFYYQFRQFIHNRQNKHDYVFAFTRQHDSLFVQVDIEGKDGLHFKAPMSLVSEAKAKRNNVSIK